MSDGITDMMIEIETQRKALISVMNVFGAKFRLQYQDYDENQFTVPIKLTEKRIDEMLNDFSIKKIEI
jgi:hypothetical protein